MSDDDRALAEAVMAIGKFGVSAEEWTRNFCRLMGAEDELAPAAAPERARDAEA